MAKERVEPITWKTAPQYGALGVGMLLIPRAYHSDLPGMLGLFKQFVQMVKRPAEHIAERP